MIRILHTADIHLDSPLQSLALRDAALRERLQAATRQAFSRIVDTALSESVAALLIAGDLFDGAGRSARTAAFLVAQLDRLDAASIPVFTIKGNHDAESPLTGEVALPGNVHVFDGRGGKLQLPGHDIWIHGVSFARRHAPDSLLDKFGAPVDGAVNIAMLHTSLGGAEGHDAYAPCSVAQLQQMGFDYWALGHVHRRNVHSQTPWIVMPGMPQGRDIGEAGPKSATLLTIENGRIDTAEVSTSVVEFTPLSLAIGGCDTAEALRAALRGALRACADGLRSDGAIVRLTLTGNSPLRWQIHRDRALWEETLRGLADETGRLWLEKLVLDLDDDRDSAEAPAGAIQELETMVAAILEEPGFADLARSELDSLMQEVPPSRRAALLPDEAARDALADRLARQGATALLARMRGASD